MNPIPQARAPNGKVVRWRFVVTAVTLAGGLIAVASAFGWQTPQQQFDELRRVDFANRAEAIAENSRQDHHMAQLDSTHLREVTMLEGMATDLCLHRSPEQRLKLRLPCRDLLRDAIISFPAQREEP
jgi:hypothetical protein